MVHTFAEVGVPVKADASFSVSRALQLQLPKQLAVLEEVSEYASREYSLERALDKMQVCYRLLKCDEQHMAFLLLPAAHIMVEHRACAPAQADKQYLAFPTCLQHIQSCLEFTLTALHMPYYLHRSLLLWQLLFDRWDTICNRHGCSDWCPCSTASRTMADLKLS